MKRAVVIVLITALLLGLCACATDTPVTLSDLTFEEVSLWTKAEWQKASEEERIEALYLLIDTTNEEVDAGKSAKASLAGFDKAFENANELTTLKEIFDAASIDKVTTEENE